MSAPAPRVSPATSDVGAADFAVAVLERSRERPVVVDFWAPWCAPCRVLGPLLESEVAALGGRVVLAKVDTDAHPTLATEYHIQGIPAVKAFRAGAVISEFVGAQPAAFVRQWLQALVPPPQLAALEQAEQAARAGDRAGAESALRALLDEAAASPEVDRLVGARALTALARSLLDAQDAAAAEPLVSRLETRGDAPDVAEVLRRRLRFFADAAAAGGREAARAASLQDPADREARYALASALAAAGELQPALELFLDLASSARKPRGDDARRAMLALFDQLGPQHDLTHEFRRRLQIVT
jgi:putative thioredoxin